VLAQARENRKLLHLELQPARRLLEQRTVRSPIDSVVMRQSLFPGELVHDEPLMTLAGLDPLRDTRSGTFGVRLRLANPEQAIVADQKCRMAFVVRIAAALPLPGVGPTITSDRDPESLTKGAR